MISADLHPAARAFDAIAPEFDARFSRWLSVSAQRSAVREALVTAFPPGARLIEIGGGTGEDALWLARQGREVLMTDASPAMVQAASSKLRGRAHATVAAAEDFGELADKFSDERRFDGAYSVFAALNCVEDLTPFACALGAMLRPGVPLLLVLFGTCCPGEMVVETLRGRPRNALRRFRRGNVPASLGGRDFVVRYHRRAALQRMLAPWFRLEVRHGIGIFVPPSAAEPWISAHPRLLEVLARLDQRAAGPLASLGDHVLYRFIRNAD